MKEILATKGKAAIVDDEYYEKLSKYSWYAFEHGKTWYVLRKDGKKTIQMHCDIVGVKPGFETDHIDGNGLNNQKSNLRLCTHSQNMMNRGMQKNNTSGYKGVSWHKHQERWCAYIWKNKKMITLGYFRSIEDAVEKRRSAVLELHGEFAKL